MKLTADIEVGGDTLVIRELTLKTRVEEIDLLALLDSVSDAPRLLEIHPRRANLSNIKRVDFGGNQ